MLGTERNFFTLYPEIPNNHCKNSAESFFKTNLTTPVLFQVFKEFEESEIGAHSNNRFRAAMIFYF